MQSPNVHRKNSLRKVQLYRCPEGFGFTLSSQGPCVLSCILAGGPAHKAGLQPGDQIIEVNGISVKSAAHEHVVKLIARSPNGMVVLSVLNRTKVQEQGKESENAEDDILEEAAINETILNRVDKVVEELRSGQLFGDSSSLRQSFSNGKLISEDEIVSDEELKASFSESIRSESSFQSSSPAQSYSSGTDEGSGVNNLSTTKLSRVLYPAMTPIQRGTRRASADIDLEPELRAIVGYLGSIELPAASSLPTASLNAIRNCVRRLRAQQKVHVFFLMEISLMGIRLMDSEKRVVVTYPLKSLAFTGLCSDDKRVFGIVTRKTNEQSSDSTSLNNRHSPNHINMDQQNTVNCSCHVFSVDPELVPHELHNGTAEKFGFKCTTQGVTGCLEFPSSSTPILRTITGMFKERTGSESCGTSSDGEGYLANRKRSVSLSSSQSESDIATPHLEDMSEIMDNVVDENVYNSSYRQFTSQLLNSGTGFQENPSGAPSVKNKEVGLVGDQYYSTERNDSGVGFNSFHHADLTSKSNCPIISVPPLVNVSSFHSRESSVDSQLSVGSHPNSGEVLESWKVKPSPVCKMATHDLSLSNSQESLAHSDIVIGHSSNKKSLNACASISSSTQSIHSLSSLPGDMTNIDGRVGRWAVGFDKLMEDPAGLECFKEFLKKEFSEENIVFWISCENFRSIIDFDVLKEEAANIFHNHLDANAPMPVNIDSCAVKDAEEQLQCPNNDMFRLQQQQVYTLMKFDSYPRFLKSDVYRQCLVAEMEGTPLPCEEGEEEGRDSKGKGFFKKRSGRGWGTKHGSKRSAGTADGDKKKSFLPWKGKQLKKGDRSFGSQPGSARSSISSLSDSIHNISYSSESLHLDQRRESESFQFCRVILPDHSSTILLCKEGQTLRQALVHLCERRQLSFVAHDVYVGGVDKLVPLEELDEEMSVMGGREIILEHRTLFRLELPDGVTLYVKAIPNQSARACLEPILIRQGFSFDHVFIHLAGCEVPLGSGVPVASIEHQLVVVETEERRTGNAHSQNSPSLVGKPPFASRTSRRGSKKGSADDIAFEEVMRGKRQTLNSGHFDDTGVWVSTMSTSKSTEYLGELNRGEGSFGKSLLRGQGLFGRKRREGSEQDKIAPVAMKSGRFGNEKPGDVKDFFELISRAQGKRMDDQRGELKGNLELPDFLKLPVNKSAASSNGNPNIPDIPPPPLLRTGLDMQLQSKPVVRKSVSTPGNLHDQVDFMQELTEKLSKRTGSVKNNSSHYKIPVDNLGRKQRSEVLLDYNFNSNGPTEHSPKRTIERTVQDKSSKVTKQRSANDVAVYKVETMPEMSSETGNHLQSAGESELRKSIAHVHPSVRPQVTQPVTVNSLRGMHHYGTNPRRNIADQAIYSRVSNVGSSKPLTMTKATSKSFQNLRDHEPTIYNVKPGSMSTDVRDDLLGTTAVNPPPQNIISAHSLPEVNSQKAEIHIPSMGPPPVPRRQVFNEDRRPRPKAVSKPEDLIVGLDNPSAAHVDASPASDRVVSPPCSDSTNSDSRVGSPLPPPPTPPSGSLYDLQIADFSPPPSIQEFPAFPTEQQADFSQTRHAVNSVGSTEDKVNDFNSLEFRGPVACVSMPRESRTSQTQWTSYGKPSTPGLRNSNMATPNSRKHSNQRGRSEDRFDASNLHSQNINELSNSDLITPTGSNLNKTVTPPSTNERTLVEDSSVEQGTPYAGHRPSVDSASKRLMPSPVGNYNPASASRVRRRNPEKRRSRQDSEIPKLDPYVTFENEDLRITFV